MERSTHVPLARKCEIGCHSSGKAGGFLTDGDSGWHSGSVGRLAKRSFALHEAGLESLFGKASVAGVGERAGARGDRLPAGEVRGAGQTARNVPA